jgi:hypothetical protein
MQTSSLLVAVLIYSLFPAFGIVLYFVAVCEWSQGMQIKMDMGYFFLIPLVYTYLYLSSVQYASENPKNMACLKIRDIRGLRNFYTGGSSLLF